MQKREHIQANSFFCWPWCARPPSHRPSGGENSCRQGRWPHPRLLLLEWFCQQRRTLGRGSPACRPADTRRSRGGQVWEQRLSRYGT